MKYNMIARDTAKQNKQYNYKNDIIKEVEDGWRRFWNHPNRRELPWNPLYHPDQSHLNFSSNNGDSNLPN